MFTTSRSALADLLARMYFWTRPSLSRSLVGRHPCWTAACFLPCTRPPDITRLRLRRPTRRPGPSERDARHAYALTRSGFQTMPRRDEDAVTEGAASATARGARAPRFGTRAHAHMTPPARVAYPEGTPPCLSTGNFYFLTLADIFSPEYFLPFCYRTPPYYWERTLSVCIMHLYSVFCL